MFQKNYIERVFSSRKGRLPELPPIAIRRFKDSFTEGAPDECWEWKRGCFDSGYGTFTYCGVQRGAHRVSYFLHYKTDPGDLYVLHRCDNPPCVNPHHLFLGTPHDNMQDALSKGRRKIGDRHYSRTNPERLVRGTKHHSAKLNEQDVIAIRQEWESKTSTSYQLAKKHGVSQAAIHNIVTYKVWRHVP